MYTVNIALKNSTNSIGLVYKAHKNADDAYRKLKATVGQKVDFEDDFGLKVCVEMDCVAAVTFSEVEKEMDKSGQFQILQTKADLRTRNNAQNDAGLKLLGQADSRLMGAN